MSPALDCGSRDPLPFRGGVVVEGSGVQISKLAIVSAASLIDVCGANFEI